MNYSIVIRGPLGSGKTTISKALCDKINARYISTDEILEKFDLEEWENGYVSISSFLKVNIIAAKIAIEKMEERFTAVIDGNFYYKNQIEDLSDRLKPYKLYTITLKVPLEVCVQRDRNRKLSFGREAVIEVYRKSTEFTYGTEIDATGVLDEVLERILSTLRDY